MCLNNIYHNQWITEQFFIGGFAKWTVVAQIIVNSYGSLFYSYYYSVAVVVTDVVATNT